MSENSLVKDLLAEMKDRERQKQVEINTYELGELGEYVSEILDKLNRSPRCMKERKETKIFTNMKDGECETANEVKIKYDIRGDEFLCDITSVCGKTGDEERAHALAAVIGAYANAVCDTPCFKIIGITPTVFMERFNKFFADLTCEFGEKFVDNITEKAG